MKRFALAALAALTITGTLAGCKEQMSEAGINAQRLLGAQEDDANWITYGRNYEEQRFSPLTKISTENVSELGLAWSADMDTARGQEATPLVMDGKMYLTHSEVPYQLRGRGIGKVLVKKTFEKLTEEGYRAVAVCSYIKAVKNRDSHWKEIIE